MMGQRGGKMDQCPMRFNLRELELSGNNHSLMAGP